MENTRQSPKVTVSPEATLKNKEFVFPDPLDEMTFRFFSIKDQERILDKGRDAYSESRIKESKTILNAIKPMVKEGDYVADVGAGTGYFTMLLSQLVGRKGRVYAVDIDPESLIYIMYMRREAAKKQGEKNNLFFDNISIILSEHENLTLPADSFDLGIMLNVHLFHYRPGLQEESGKGKDIYFSPEEQEVVIEEIYKEQKNFIESIHKCMKKDGRFVVIEDVSVRSVSPRLRKKNVARVLEKGGFVLEKELDVLPDNHFLIFRKK